MTKTILITGATDGIGRLAAQQLAEQGHKVLLHGRNPDKLAQAAADIDGQTDTFVADLSDLDATRAMAAKLVATYDRIDVVINNAGILRTSQTIAKSGRDIRFEVNTIAPYLLTRALLPIIPATGRVINLSSAAQAPIDIDAINGERTLDHMEAYAQSKLAITIWSAEMAKELPNGPAIIPVNPGSLLASKMVKEGFGIEGNDLQIGADILMRAALSDDFADASGKYFDNDSGRFASPHSAAGDPAHVSAVMRALDALIAT